MSIRMPYGQTADLSTMLAGAFVGNDALFFRLPAYSQYAAEAGLMQLMRDGELPNLHAGGYGILPLIVGVDAPMDQLTVGYESIQLTKFVPQSLMTIVTGQRLYLAGQDEAVIKVWGKELVGLPTVKVDLEVDGRHQRTITIRLTKVGLGVHKEPNLPTGKYTVRVQNSDASYTFHVAAYDPTQMEIALLGTPEKTRLGFKGRVAITSGGRPVTGVVTLLLRTGGFDLDEIEVEPDASGETEFKFRDTDYDGPLSIGARYDAGFGIRTAEVMIPRSSAAERGSTALSTSGIKHEVSAMPMPGSVRKGDWEVKSTPNDDGAPIHLVTAVGPQAVIRLMTKVAKMVLTLVDESTGRVLSYEQFSDVSPAQGDITFAIPQPACLLSVAAWVYQGESDEPVPWESKYQLLQVQANPLSVHVQSPTEVQPGEQVTLTITSNMPSAPAVAVVEVTDRRATYQTLRDDWLGKVLASAQAFEQYVGATFVTKLFEPVKAKNITRSGGGYRTLETLGGDTRSFGIGEPQVLEAAVFGGAHWESFGLATEESLTAELAPWQMSRMFDRRMTMTTQVVTLEDGQAELTFTASDTIAEYSVRVTLVSQDGQCAQDMTWLKVDKPVYVLAELPSRVALGEPALAVFTPMANSPTVELTLTLAGEQIYHEVVPAGKPVQVWLERPGYLEVLAVNTDTREMDAMMAVIQEAGVIRTTMTKYRVVEPNTTVIPVGKMWFVGAGPAKAPGIKIIDRYCRITDLKRCCQQTASAWLSAVLLYATGDDSAAALVNTYFTRMLTMKVPDGFLFYPLKETNNQVRRNKHYEELAGQNLQAIADMARHPRVRAHSEVRRAVEGAGQLVAHAIRVYGHQAIWPTDGNVANRLLAAWVANDMSAGARIVDALPASDGKNELVRFGMYPTLNNVAACYAAMILLRAKRYDAAFRLINAIFDSVDDSGALPTTDDSTALMLLLVQMDEARLPVFSGDANATVFIDGEELSLEKAAERNTVGEFTTGDSPVMVGYEALYELDLHEHTAGPNPMRVALIPTTPGVTAQPISQNGVNGWILPVGTYVKIRMQLVNPCPVDGLMARLFLPPCLSITGEGMLVKEAITDMRMGQIWELEALVTSPTQDMGFQTAWLQNNGMYVDPRKESTTFQVAIMAVANN